MDDRKAARMEEMRRALLATAERREREEAERCARAARLDAVLRELFPPCYDNCFSMSREALDTVLAVLRSTNYARTLDADECERVVAVACDALDGAYARALQKDHG